MNLFHWLENVRHGFESCDCDILNDTEQVCEDEKFKELLDDNPTQTNQYLEVSLKESQKTISKCIREMSNINKFDYQMENRKVTCGMRLVKICKIEGEKVVRYSNLAKSVSNTKAKSRRQEDHSFRAAVHHRPGAI